MKKIALVPSLPETMKITDDPLLLDIINEVNSPDDSDFETIKAMMVEMITEKLLAGSK